MTNRQRVNFWNKVNKRSGIFSLVNGRRSECWMWNGLVDKNGYGRTSVDSAHRVSWMLHKGPIPKQKLICHHCDNPGCVRPSHLFLGTNQSNSSDMVAKNRQATGIRHGRTLHPEMVLRAESHPMAKLNWISVRMIRRLNKRGVPQKDLCAKFNVSSGNMSHIISGRYWKETDHEESQSA